LQQEISVRLNKLNKKQIQMKKHLFLIAVLAFAGLLATAQSRKTIDFTCDWKFALNITADASGSNFDDSGWRTLQLPHDWSIESDFSDKFAATPGGGALPGGLGWYRKSFMADQAWKNKKVFIDFDGVYRKSEVWINGHYLGMRPYGYISFRYDLTPYINLNGNNVVAVKVDNSEQPNSRWYSGSGIYRKVQLTITEPVHIENWGTYVTTPEVSGKSAQIRIETTVKNDLTVSKNIEVKQLIKDKAGKTVASANGILKVDAGATGINTRKINLLKPQLWSTDRPYLYTVVTQLFDNTRKIDEYSTPLGVRYFKFDAEKGFSLNGKPMKLNGVCNHHDLGALGSAVNYRATERQIEIMKEMGVNSIRTSHNPPSNELLELCDKIGVIVMDEAFDMWRMGKTKYDYSLDFDKWHERDLTDQVLRDRNHPSVFMWSIGNEIVEQWGEDTITTNLQQANVLLNNRKVNDKSGKLGKNAKLTKHLADIVKNLDKTRLVTAACNGTDENNPLFRAEALDLIGYNYHETDFAAVPKKHPGLPFVSSESVSSLQTRGFYIMPSDSVNIWPERWDKPFSNPLQKCSAYDNCRAPWGETHETMLKMVKKYPFVSGQYIWTGFDYLGEPTPYWWPSRSSYFGIVDMAGFPKDVFYLYKSEWTSQPVLHIFPHWNWQPGQTVDVWAYYNNADDVELFLNGRSLGKKSKTDDVFHVMWRVKYEPGTLKAISRKNGKTVLTEEIRTASTPVKIRLTADRNTIKADGKDLSFVTVEISDKDGNTYPLADQLVRFSVEGNGTIAGTDNGDQNDPNSLKKPERKLFFGKCLAIVQNNGKPGTIILTATVDGLPTAKLNIICK